MIKAEINKENLTLEVDGTIWDMAAELGIIAAEMSYELKTKEEQEAFFNSLTQAVFVEENKFLFVTKEEMEDE